MLASTADLVDPKISVKKAVNKRKVTSKKKIHTFENIF
jgi:hypothetical protein